MEEEEGREGGTCRDAQAKVGLDDSVSKMRQLQSSAATEL